MATTYTDTPICIFVINKMTAEEYAGITPDPNQLYLLPEPYPLPTGVILSYGGATAPTGFLLCDGAAVNRTQYATLFAAIGTAFGSGDGTTTFNVPDMREVVPVGAGTSTNSSIADHDSYNLGEFKDDQTQSHEHAVGIGTAQLGYVNSELVDISKYYRFQGSSATSPVKGGNLETVSESGRNGTTTHGKQLGVNYIIKY